MMYNLLYFLQSDSNSLSTYERGDIVPFERLSSNLYSCLKDRTGSKQQFLQSAKKNFEDCKGAKSIAKVFMEKLPSLACSFLELDDDNWLCVKEGRWNDWQMLLQDMSPLLLVISFLWKDLKDRELDEQGRMRILKQNLLHTVLPNSRNRFLNGLKSENGLNDIHIHYVATMEADRAWLYMLIHIDEFRMKTKTIEEKIFRDDKIKNYADLDRRLNQIRKLAEHLTKIVYHPIDDKLIDFGCILNDVNQEGEVVIMHDHPMLSYLDDSVSDLIAEGFLWYKVFDTINEFVEKDSLASLFHYYLVMIGSLRHFLVMAAKNIGLYDFNETLALPYRKSDFDILSVEQIFGNQENNCFHLELRHFPCKSAAIVNVQEVKQKIKEKYSKEFNAVLVATFSKAKDNLKTDEFRHEKLRRAILKKTEKLVSRYRKDYVGIDVAGLDFNAGPEVFSEAFHYLRQKGMNNFTYHVGEDFYHILDGLRNIFEVVEFLEFGENNRLAHVTAAGISPKEWERQFECGILTIPQGIYLDDLIFCYHLIMERRINIDPKKIEKLVKEIDKLSKSIYDHKCTVSDLISAWLLRKESPKEYLRKNSPSPIEELIKDYHDKEIRKKYSSEIDIECLEIFDEDDLVIFQKEIMKLLGERRLVVECLPTSNVYINRYPSFKSYHLKTWLRWKYLEHLTPMPEFVLGSDEIGVFPTNIFIEYANLYDMLKKDSNFSEFQVRNIVKIIANNGKIYSFC